MAVGSGQRPRWRCKEVGPELVHSVTQRAAAKSCSEKAELSFNLITPERFNDFVSFGVRLARSSIMNLGQSTMKEFFDGCMFKTHPDRENANFLMEKDA